MIKQIILVLLLGSYTTILYSQQEAQFTQYLDNMLYYNPAYAGSNDHLNITAIHRQQWVGIDGAPMTQSLTFHTPLKYESLGVGLSVLNDRVGPLNQTWVNLDLSYTLSFKKTSGQLSFGLKGGVNFVNNDLSGLNVIDQADADLSTNVSEVLPNFGAGVYYHSKKFFAGLSSPRIVENPLKTNGSLTYLDRRHYYATIGGYFKVNRMLKLRPSALLKVVPDAPFGLDGSLAFIFYDKLWLGANYRFMEGAGAFFQIQFANQLKFGYGFELSTTELMRNNFGTHEIMLSYDFSFNKKSITSVRYF